MMTTGLRPGYTTFFHLPLMNTTGLCIRFFYRIVGTAESTITVKIINPSLTVEKEKSYTASGMNYWNGAFFDLPPNLNYFEIHGQRGLKGTSGIKIDDIEITSCANFIGEHCNRCPYYVHTLILYLTERECLEFSDGSGYVGNVSVTSNNVECIPWETYASAYELSDDDFLDGSIAAAGNKCRHLNNNRYGGSRPICMAIPFSLLSLQPCDIGRCCELTRCGQWFSPFLYCIFTACRPEFFRCVSSKICISKNLLCDSVNHCADRTDELYPCRKFG
jgi:hypothetical protein